MRVNAAFCLYFLSSTSRAGDVELLRRGLRAAASGRVFVFGEVYCLFSTGEGRARVFNIIALMARGRIRAASARRRCEPDRHARPAKSNLGSHAAGNDRTLCRCLIRSGCCLRGECLERERRIRSGGTRRGGVGVGTASPRRGRAGGGWYGRGGLEAGERTSPTARERSDRCLGASGQRRRRQPGGPVASGFGGWGSVRCR